MPRDLWDEAVPEELESPVAVVVASRGREADDVAGVDVAIDHAPAVEVRKGLKAVPRDVENDRVSELIVPRFDSGTGEAFSDEEV